MLTKISIDIGENTTITDGDIDNSVPPVVDIQTLTSGGSTITSLYFNSKERLTDFILKLGELNSEPGILERNDALNESKGKWELIKQLGVRGDYAAIERVMGTQCGLCVLAHACVLCPANDRCKNLQSTLIDAIDEDQINEADVMRAISDILEYIDELKVKWGGNDTIPR